MAIPAQQLSARVNTDNLAEARRRAKRVERAGRELARSLGELETHLADLGIKVEIIPTNDTPEVPQ